MTTAPPAGTQRRRATRREWTRLEAPSAVLLAVVLVAIDGVTAVVLGIVIGDASCRSGACRANGVSVSRPVVGLLLALALVVVPLLVAWWRHRGLRTVAVVQLLVGALLVTWAATSITTALAVRRDPPPVPMQPSLRPCAEQTLAGHVCLTYSETPPAPPVSPR